MVLLIYMPKYCTETKDWAIFRMMKFLSVKCSNTYNQHGDDADADADEAHLRRSFICQGHRPSFTIFWNNKCHVPER